MSIRRLTPISARRRIAASVLTLGCAVLAGFVFLGISAPGSPDAVLDSVPADLYEQQGIQLSPPVSVPSTSIDVSQADRVSVNRAPGSKIVESKLLNVDAQTTTGEIKCLCWVVSTDPPGGIFISGPLGGTEAQRATAIANLRSQMQNPYHLDFIDAESGKWLFAAEGARVP